MSNGSYFPRAYWGGNESLKGGGQKNKKIKEGKFPSLKSNRGDIESHKKPENKRNGRKGVRGKISLNGDYYEKKGRSALVNQSKVV